MTSHRAVAGEVTTWVRGLHEPAGLALSSGRVYVADTNAHRIAAVDEASGRIDTLDVTGLQRPLRGSRPGAECASCRRAPT